MHLNFNTLFLLFQNEKLISKLSEMPWYMMSKKSQLGYVHLLNRLQNGAVFRMGPFAELNFETLSNVITHFKLSIQPSALIFHLNFIFR